jgi:hypothetical protein
MLPVYKAYLAANLVYRSEIPHEYTSYNCVFDAGIVSFAKNWVVYAESTNSSILVTFVLSFVKLRIKAYSFAYLPTAVSALLEACIKLVRASISWSSLWTLTVKLENKGIMLSKYVRYSVLFLAGLPIEEGKTCCRHSGVR